MSSPAKPDPEAHLVVLCDRLDLEPVIRHMRQSKCLTMEHAQLVRSHPTSPMKIEALVDLLKSDERVAGFMLALWATNQSDLAQLIDPPSDPTMAASQSQPSLPSHSEAVSAATSSQAASSSQAEMLQLLQADLDALVLRRVQEALSSPGLATAASSASLQGLGGSDVQEASGPSGASGQMSAVSEIDLAPSWAASLPASQTVPDGLAQRRVQEAMISEARATGESSQHGRDAQEAAADGSFKPQIVITGGENQEHKMELIDVNSRQSVLLTMDRPRREHCCAQISPGKLLLAGGRDEKREPIQDCHYVTIQSSPSYSLSELDVCSPKRSVSCAALAAVGGGAYLAGGWGYDGGWLVSKLNKWNQDESIFDNLWYFDGLKWSPRKAMPRPRHWFALLPLGEERLYAVGGGEAAVDCYEVGRDRWRTLKGHSIWGNSAALIGRRIYALRNFTANDELDILDLDNGERSEGPKLSKAREYPGLVSVGGRLVALGGKGAQRSVEVLDLRAGRWEELEGFQLKMSCYTEFGPAVCAIDL